MALENKKVLFITTKNIDYIRNQQEIKKLKEKYKKIDVVNSKSKYTIIRILVVNLKMVFYLFRHYDIIFVAFLPQFVVWIKTLRKKQEQCLVIDFFIGVYDTLVSDRKKVKEKSILAKWLKQLDKRVINQADYIIMDTKQDASYFSSQFSIPLEKIKVWYLEADPQIYHKEITPIEPPELENKYVVLYFGTILPLQGVEVILEASHLLAEKKNIQFVIIGMKNSEITIKQKKYPNVIYIPWLKQEQLAGYIARADICLAGHFQAKIEKATRTIPGKAYIYQAMGKKMVLGDNLANREKFTEDQQKNLYVEMGNAKKLAQLIERQWLDKNYINSYNEKNKRGGEENEKRKIQKP